MDRAQLLRHFDTLADTPHAVPKLRSMVLQLAVEGRLLPREPDAEAASGLAAALDKARAKAAAEGMAPKAKPLPISDTEKFIPDVPAHWIWLRLSQLGWIAGGSTPSMNNPRFWDGGVPWVTPKDMKSATITSSEMSVSKLALESTSLRLYPKGSILIVGRSGILKRTLPVSVSAIECTVNQDLKVIVPFLEKLSPFIRLLLRGHETYILGHLVKGGMTVQSLKYEEFEQQAFPVPPLTEQKRIVARVEELLALCDELEARQTAAREQRTRLVQSAFDHLTAATPADFRRHAAFALQEFPHLTATPDSIPALRQAVLSLAVQGRLGAQSDSEWKPVELRQLASLITSGSRGWAEFYAKEGPLFIRAQNVRREGHLLLDDIAHVQFPKDSEGSRTRVAKDDVLVVITGAGVAQSARVLDDLGEAYVSQHVALIRLKNPEFAPWLELQMHAPAGCLGQLRTLIYGAKPGLNLENLRALELKVPPLAEQKRIVAKVAELMRWCDELEAQLITAETAGAALLDSSLHALLAG